MKHKFVEFIPDVLEDGVLYISIDYATATHKCACGCGNEVVTPFSPTDWKMTFNGEAVSLHPSIGNWSFDCQSHYWIKYNRVKWSDKWTEKEIKTNRISDKQSKKNYYQVKETKHDGVLTANEISQKKYLVEASPKLWQRVKNWLVFWKN